MKLHAFSVYYLRQCLISDTVGDVSTSTWSTSTNRSLPTTLSMTPEKANATKTGIDSRPQKK